MTVGILSSTFQPDDVPSERSFERNEEASSRSTASSSNNKVFRSPLPQDFQPTNYSVVCGRGKECFNHVGNARFRVIVSMFLDRYSKTNNKNLKGSIVSDIVDIIRQAGGHFCKYENGTWYEVGDAVAREKVGSLFRDYLHTQYRSSAKAKMARRKVQLQKQNGSEDYPLDIDNSKRQEEAEESKSYNDYFPDVPTNFLRSSFTSLSLHSLDEDDELLACQMLGV